MRARILGIIALLASTTALSCGGESSGQPAAARAQAAPSWADVFDGTPDLYAVIRPRAMKRDPLYGSFFSALMRAAQARGIARGDTMVRAIEGADEVIIGINKGLDAALVVRGVPASLDPQKVLDAEGNPLFGLASDRGKVAEYELLDKKNAGLGRLFVLPARTWTFAVGDARTRARTVFAKPVGRPKPELDPGALVVVRAAGGMTHALETHARLNALAKKLSSVTVALQPGKGGVVVALAYEDASAVAWAEMHAKRIVAELAKEERNAWLREAKVAYEGNTLYVRVAVPPRLLEELPNASGADLGI
jgi:hypothetical protein